MSHSHKKPISRRDFMAAGLIPAATGLLLPNWLKVLSTPPSALAASACAPPDSSMPAFMQVDLAGGAGLCASYIPLDGANQMLSNYNKLGLGATAGITTQAEFGGVLFPSTTLIPVGFINGVRLGATAPTLANSAFVAVCVRSQDDSSNNAFDISGMLSASGLAGALVPHTGTENTLTGGRHRSAVVAAKAPLVVRSVNDLTTAVGFSASLNAGTFNATQRTALAKLVTNLNGAQQRKLAALKTGAEVQDLLSCAGIKNQSLVGGGSAALLDPAVANATVNNAWAPVGTTTNFAGNRNQFAAIGFNALNGNSAGGNITLGGFDYHNNARAGTDQRDQDAGVIVGCILETARILNKKTFIYVTSDGSVSTDSTTATSDWAGDSGSNGNSFIIAYDPAGRPATSGPQIGYYTNQAADDKTIVGGNPEVAAAAVFANYLQFGNNLGAFSAIAGRQIASADLGKVLKFG